MHSRRSFPPLRYSISAAHSFNERVMAVSVRCCPVNESEPNRGRQFPSTLTNVMDGMTASHPITKSRRKEPASPTGTLSRFRYAGDVANRSEVLCD